MQIEFSCHDVEYKLMHEPQIKAIIDSILSDHNFKGDFINYIFCSVDSIVSINRKYLQHDYATDIITFPYVDDRIISTDIYICVPQVMANAIEYNSGEEQEMARVIFHGILHMVGYDDHTPDDIQAMRNAEDLYLKVYNARVKGEELAD